jgi:hypothetical protein
VQPSSRRSGGRNAQKTAWQIAGDSFKCSSANADTVSQAACFKHSEPSPYFHAGLVLLVFEAIIAPPPWVADQTPELGGIPPVGLENSGESGFLQAPLVFSLIPECTPGKRLPERQHGKEPMIIWCHVWRIERWPSKEQPRWSLVSLQGHAGALGQVVFSSLQSHLSPGAPAGRWSRT